MADDKRPAESSSHINLKVTGQDESEVLFFRIRRCTQLKKLMDAYCQRRSLELDTVAFLFDGKHLRGEHTPDEAGMEDGDEIDAMVRQYGGAATSQLGALIF